MSPSTSTTRDRPNPTTLVMVFVPCGSLTDCIKKRLDPVDVVKGSRPPRRSAGVAHINGTGILHRGQQISFYSHTLLFFIFFTSQSFTSFPSLFHHPFFFPTPSSSITITQTILFAFIFSLISLHSHFFTFLSYSFFIVPFSISFHSHFCFFFSSLTYSFLCSFSNINSVFLSFDGTTPS